MKKRNEHPDRFSSNWSERDQGCPVHCSPERLIVALDFSDPGQARNLVEQLKPTGVSFKIGLELYMAGGPDLVGDLAARHNIFLDLKFHDIPNTVAAAVRSAASLGVSMINLHAAGGRKMITAARDAVESLDRRPILLAVTVLTSMGDQEMHETGCPGSTAERVLQLAGLVSECGLDGVVCSPLEIAEIKAKVSPPLITVTPGIRPAGDAQDDQFRVGAPAEAIRSGGDYLVVGRPVTRAAEPLSAARRILTEMGVDQ